nr:MAG TPA: hypothetical protein [Caudoviricetes sp.]DAU93754.1 MAG TPA: hypothetical protein [Caudoviricetes sp.]
MPRIRRRRREIQPDQSACIPNAAGICKREKRR